MNIQTYLDTLNLETTSLGLKQIQELQVKHLVNYSFSSINAMKPDLLPLELNDVLDRLIAKRQGGYCFEHNKIAFEALKYLGYDVQLLLARVKLSGAQDNARTHRITLVHLGDESYVVDVGFGSKNPLAPINVTRSGFVEIGSMRYWVDRNEQEFEIKLVEPEEVILYSADFSHANENDCNVGHFFSHQHPSSGFVQNLVLSRNEGHTIHTLRNLLLKTYDVATNTSQEVTLTSVDALKQVIEAQFLVSLNNTDIQFIFDKAQANMLSQ
ncbi:arylamine N-acetyltransferase family protein [Pseudoalteromonas xiamenensis]|uniref:Arylamine N-acetyltransferase n=1 Tax=Pseudoalteromonas xiamenensis TaxID=882626 RepID=A0A975DF04_9GAMM|nr:arylamine N-acetyltransferase [Pseudoalteromonas xiamenensis]QTH70603.1 arylamine N-acetyltransferase [Pseudoalteromonas xiamenensis]